jgi:RNA polymerase sigma-70 factor (ECF subfamily)
MFPDGQGTASDARASDERGLAALLSDAASDRRAFERFYELTHRRVYGLCLAILSDEDAAEDATLEVYAQIWRQAATFDPHRGGLWTWVLSITRTRALDQVRARQRRSSRWAPGDAALEPRSPEPDPHAWCAGEEHARIVRESVARLPEAQREAIETAYFCGLSYAETAEALSLPVGTIKTRIRAGLATLRSSLQAHQRELR